MRRLLKILFLLVASCASAVAEVQGPGYPAQCSVIDYCARVDRIVWTDTSSNDQPRVLVVTDGREGLMVDPFPVLTSFDGMMHACLRYDPFGQLVVTCLLLPSPHRH